MSIEFTCPCGHRLRVAATLAGKRGRCPSCSNMLTVPVATPDVELDLVPLAAPSAPTAPRPVAAVRPAAIGPSSRFQGNPTPAARHGRPALTMGPPPSRLKQLAYLLLIFALLPLILSTFHSNEDRMKERMISTLNSHPEISDIDQKFGQVISGEKTLDSFLALLPGDRLDGALLPRNSHTQWLMGVGAAAAFFAFLLLVVPYARHMTGGMIFAALFTATVGIVVLLGFQFAAFGMPWIVPRGVIGLILLIVKLIGLSYSLADGDTNFFLSFVGFTCGVGLCEEATKAIPVLLRIRPAPMKEDPTWNNLLLWGFASGVGFGVAEGIMYSSRYYNGMEGSEIYFVRFFSCVALHVMWAGAVAISIYRNIPEFNAAGSGWGYCFQLVKCMIVPMVLHGLYDTLLKKDHELVALLVAVASFAWLVYEVEAIRRQEPLSEVVSA